MTSSAVPSPERIVQAARRAFGERGYTAVTIREVAVEAGVSPALVMKVAGSKEQLYAMARPTEPLPLDPDIPLAGLGEILVRRMLARREADEAEPWLRALHLLLDSPDPAAARADFRARFLGRFEGLPGGPAQADQLACLLLGLAAGLRSFRLLEAGATDTEALVRDYGGLVQQVIDRLAQEPDDEVGGSSA